MTDADKRERIIEAAYKVLSEKGYDKASTKEIASTAGVAQGLINYYFPSKDHLFAEVFRRETERYCHSFNELISYDRPLPLSFDAIAELLKVPKSRALEEPEWFRLRYELFAIGLRNESAMPILKEMLETKRQHISDTVSALSGLPAGQTDTIAAILYALIEGLGLQKIADPDFKYDEAYEMLGVMLGTYYEFIRKNAEE